MNVGSVATLTFAIGVASAGAGGSIASVLYPFLPGSHYQWIARLLGIIVLGGMGTLPGAVVGALALGVAETMTVTYIGPEWATAVPYVVRDHRAALAATGPARLAPARGRGDGMSARIRSPWTWLAVLAVVLVGIYPLLSDDLYYQNMIILSMVFAVGAVGLNIITGYAGYVSLGQGAFLGLGAYVVGHRRDQGRRLALAVDRRRGSRGGAVRRRCSASSRCGRAATRS